ncbi:MAG: DUF4340 domain-containing protein, partial [Planctomycetota bacterium]
MNGNHLNTTLIFLGTAAVLVVAATMASFRGSTDEDQAGKIVNTELFAEFEDPLAVSRLSITSYDEELATLSNFRVENRPDQGWVIEPDGYPADAIDQVKNAANILIGVKVLDVIEQANAAEFGVVDPSGDIEPGDTGVGRLVTFHAGEEKLASLVIGDEVKDGDGKIYVRKPSQDAVYIVKLNDGELTTNFTDWIEDDLLQLNEFDLREIKIENYQLVVDGRSAGIEKQFDAVISTPGDSSWELKSLVEYDKNVGANVKLGDDQQINATKLNAAKSALDDLKIVNVQPKPDGISPDLTLDSNSVQNVEAMISLQSSGFIPARTDNPNQFDLVSANGQLTATMQDGVQYLLRFGNISGATKEGENE